MNMAESLRMYANYLNGMAVARENMDDEEFELYEQDMANAQAAVFDLHFEVAEAT